MRFFQVAPFTALAGLVVGLGVDQIDETDKTLRVGLATAREFLTGSAALGAAFGAIVIAVLALVSVWFDGIYLDVLDEQNGWDYAMRPFRVTGTVSVLTTLFSVIGIFTFAQAPLVWQAIIIGLTSGLLIWSIFGTLIVVSLLFEHGHDRAELQGQLKRDAVLQKISEIPKDVTPDERERQRNLLIQTLTPRQQSLLLDDLRASEAPSSPD
ncbi:MAG: hypothetical protein WB565_13215 [Acidimicrobiales bacterium]